MTKDFYFNTAKAMDKAKADRDKPVTPVEYKPVISDVGSDSNMLWPDTPFVPKGTGKITLLESKPNTWVMRITADRRIEVNEDVEVTEAAQKVLDAMRCLLAALPAPVQETPFQIGQRLRQEGKGISDLWGAVSSDADMPEAQRGFDTAAPVQEPHKDKIIKSTLSAFGPDEGVTFTQDTWAKLHAAMSAVVAQQAPVQVSPLEFVTMVMEREHLVGKPLFWAEWPNKENT